MRFTGAVGAYNSILIEDLDSRAHAPGPELYLAGSMGIRKLVRL